MEAGRFDALARLLADRSSRRTAVLGIIAAAGGLAVNRAWRPGLAQEAASPVATPAASPGPLDLLAGSPAADGAALARFGEGGCKALYDPCTSTTECCSGAAVCSAYRGFDTWVCVEFPSSGSKKARDPLP